MIKTTFKIYCKNCDRYSKDCLNYEDVARILGIVPIYRESCRFIADNYLNVDQEIIADPAIQNKNNDCQYFIPKKDK